MNALLAIASIGTAAIVPKHETLNSTALYCGTKTDLLCANSTEAVSPIKVVDGEYVTNQFLFTNYPGVTTFLECKAACSREYGCESFQYVFDEGNIEVGPSWECHLLYKTVDEYVIPCSALSDAVSLNTYYDAACEALPKVTSGVIATGADMSCNSNGTVYDPQHLYRDQISAANATQAECKEMCTENQDCKSYFYNPYGAGSFYPEYSPYSSYPASGGGNTTDIDNLEPNAVCVLLSQPVKGYTVDDSNIFVHEFYDVECPIDSD
ncbi:hypothetical protein K431DRAFT_316049 [Polychaeton citri CBS 116435]|uniref:Apple domain-containing protein n=1 Tax=Polychaeton citri CBS 116435 TaxID=1314669 RepID=A0A9P4Q0A3_9PEZI|nr:hypothetical protein K431DRAFT_316049 [Polychaeton citri CBS 116435]